MPHSFHRRDKEGKTQHRLYIHVNGLAMPRTLYTLHHWPSSVYDSQVRNLWPPHFRTFCELVEGEENKLTTFSTWVRV